MANKEFEIKDWSDGFKSDLSADVSLLNSYNFVDNIDFDQGYEGAPAKNILFDALAIRKKSFTSEIPGIWEGIDFDGVPKMYIGDTEKFFLWDGENFILSADSQFIFSRDGHLAASFSVEYDSATDTGSFKILGADGVIGLIIESAIGAGTVGLVSVGALDMTGFGGSVIAIMNGEMHSTGIMRPKRGTAPVAGGTHYIRLGSVTSLGIYAGSGAPSVSAPKGSLYLRTDGSGVNDRAYVNTDGSTTWTSIVTVA